MSQEAVKNEVENLSEACSELQSAVTNWNDRKRNRRHAQTAHIAAEKLVEVAQEAFEGAVAKHNCGDLISDDDPVKDAIHQGDLPRDVQMYAEVANTARAARNEIFYVAEEMPSPRPDDYKASVDNVEYYLDSLTDELN